MSSEFLPVSRRQIIDRMIERVGQYSADTRVILLHPRSRYRSALVARLLTHAPLPVYYHALGTHVAALPTFLNRLVEDLARQVPTFGRYCYRLTPDAPASAYLDAVAHDLSQLGDQPYLLILDDYDHSDDADEIQHFIERLSARLPAHCTLLINSRTMPRLPWVSMIARHDAVILADDHIVKDDFYRTRTKAPPTLTVNGFGSGTIAVDDQRIDHWEGHLPRLLLFLALDRPTITRAEICETFWPTLDPEGAVNVFHVTKRRLHKALDTDVLLHDHDYRVNPALDVQYDVTEFVSRLCEARDPHHPHAIAAYQEAAALYRGAFLKHHNDPWCVARRADFRTGQLEALRALGTARREQGKREQALGYFLRALDEDDAQEDLHREIMRLYASMGRRSEAAGYYLHLTDRWREAGASLSGETHALYHTIIA